MSGAWTRRRLLGVGLTAAGGLLLRFPWQALAETTAPAPPWAPNGYLRIDPDGRVTLRAPIPDMGQGTRTSLPLVVAEELDVPLSAVALEQADLDPQLFPEGQGAGGSTSLYEGWEPARRAGAAARALLVEAAARRWGVPSAQCFTGDGAVRHSTRGLIRYGELLAAASALPVPAAPVPKAARDYRQVGRRVGGLDVPAIVRGEPRFGLDVRLPQTTLRAAIAHAPSHGARLLSFDPAPALALPGVRRVLRIAGLPNPTQLRPGVAVLADSTWAAWRGRDALTVSWDESAAKEGDSDRLRERFAELAALPGKVLRESGDVEAALAAGGPVLDVRYEAPFLAHACMEPMNCTAWVRDGRCDVWGPLQQPGGARRVVALATGLPEAAIAVHPTRIGGGFGRRLLSDLAAEAAVLSRDAGAPVQVVWTREDDLRHDYYRQAGLHRVRAALDGKGAVTAWHHRIVGVSRNVYRQDPRPPESTETYGLFAPYGSTPEEDSESDLVPFRVPNVRLEFTPVATQIPTGAWRAPAHNVNAFVIESVIDELAHLGRRDPLALRIEVLGRRSDFPRLAGEYDPDRVAEALRRVAAAIGWGEPLPRGEGVGLAGHFTFSSCAAVALHVAVGDAGVLRMLGAVVAVDCGLVVNRGGVEAQAEGGVIDGLGSALWGEITVRGGRTEQSSFDGYRLLRLPEAPPVEVIVLEHGDAKPRGLGEVALPPAAPALANAIFAATGIRLRRMPLGPELAARWAERSRGA